MLYTAYRLIVFADDLRAVADQRVVGDQLIETTAEGGPRVLQRNERVREGLSRGCLTRSEFNSLQQRTTKAASSTGAVCLKVAQQLCSAASYRRTLQSQLLTSSMSAWPAKRSELTPSPGGASVSSRPRLGVICFFAL
jgi:hypothetical protein